jgi:pyridoxine 5-phosphate synthase
VVRLSVNVNKVATLRNARGGREPRVLDAVDVCLRAGAAGITVHPREDRRHITPDDVREIARALAPVRPGIEYNIEGDPRAELIELVREVRPEQCTLVPVKPGEVTSQAGWRPGSSTAGLEPVIRDFRARGIRVSIFVDAVSDTIRWAASVGADRVELYTEPFARAVASAGPDGAATLATIGEYAKCAELGHGLGLGVNAGHDLDLSNLMIFRDLPHLDEVSIGHAIVSRALYVGLSTAVSEYRNVLEGAGGAAA